MTCLLSGWVWKLRLKLIEVMESPRKSQSSLAPWGALYTSRLMLTMLGSVPRVMWSRIQLAPVRDTRCWGKPRMLFVTVTTGVQPVAGGLVPPGARFVSMV